MGHADGRCHVYVDEKADLQKAVRVVVDSKTHYPAACNAMETLLVHRDRASEVLREVSAALPETTKFHADEASIGFLPSVQTVQAKDEDWQTEWLAVECNVKVVDDIAEAINHVNTYGSCHTDAIVTENPGAADAWVQGVDSAGVYVNCSTRFADGFRYGFGAEVGIATGRIHARGPVGLEGLVTYKYRLYGDGQVAKDYDSKKYKHAPIAPFPKDVEAIAAKHSVSTKGTAKKPVKATTKKPAKATTAKPAKKTTTKK
jgi:glutamate-5-semialdehyde dehydrogenase